MAVFSVNGVEFDGLHLGKGNKPAMLVLHGANGPVSMTAACQRMAEHFEVLAPAHPGFGHSPTVPAIDSIDDLAYLYLDLMEAMDLRDVVVMGFSMGGWIASEIAVKSTARIGRLILVDAVGIRVPGREDCQIADLFNIHPAKIPALVFHDLSLAPDPSAMSEQEMVLATKAREAAVRYTWEPYMHNPKLAGRLHRIDVPTLVLWGKYDGIVPLAYGKEYCALIPGAQMKVFEKSGHSPLTEQADEFLAAVTEFAAAEKAAA